MHDCDFSYFYVAIKTAQHVFNVKYFLNHGIFVSALLLLLCPNISMHLLVMRTYYL